MNVLSFILNVKDELSGGLSRAKAAVSSYASGFSGIGNMIAGAFSVAAVTAFTNSVIAYVGQIKDAADTTKLSTDQFQALSVEAKQNGIDIGTLTGSLQRLRNIQGSIGSDKNLQEAFKRLKMGVDEVAGVAPDKLLERIAIQIRNTGNESAAFDIFGKSAGKLTTTLKELANGWQSLIAKNKAAIIEQDDIRLVDEMGDKLDVLGTRAKTMGARMLSASIDAYAFWKSVAGGKTFGEASEDLKTDKLDKWIAAARTARMEREATAKEEKAAVEKAKSDEIAKEQKTGADLQSESAKSKMTDKEYEIYLNEKIADQVKATMEDGLSALELQRRRNEALKTGIELFQLEKKIAADEMRAREEFNRDVDKRDKDRADAKKVVDEYRLEQMTPEARLAEMNKRVESKRRDIVAEPDEDKAALLIMQQKDILKERDAVKREVEDKKKTAEDRRKSLMDSDRELRDMTMTPEQRMKESKAAQQDIAKKLETEKDPEKRFELEKQLREEMKIQLGISTEKGAKQERALSLGDVNDRMRGVGGKRDPQAEANDLARQMLASLKEIEKKKGGMVP